MFASVVWCNTLMINIPVIILMNIPVIISSNGQTTDCVTGVFGSSGRGARSSLVLGAHQTIPSVACGSPRTAPV